MHVFMQIYVYIIIYLHVICICPIFIYKSGFFVLVFVLFSRIPVSCGSPLLVITINESSIIRTSANHRNKVGNLLKAAGFSWIFFTFLFSHWPYLYFVFFCTPVTWKCLRRNLSLWCHQVSRDKSLKVQSLFFIFSERRAKIKSCR